MEARHHEASGEICRICTPICPSLGWVSSARAGLFSFSALTRWRVWWCRRRRRLEDHEQADRAKAYHD
jgi:hypothetical protein